MSAQADLVTVYRSMDAGAEEDSEAIRRLLVAQGIAAEIVDDSAPDVPEGTFEVRVPAAASAQAEKLIAEEAPDQPPDGDPSADLDLETVFSGEGGTTSEMEALSVKNLLEFNGITAVLVGDSVLPNLSFEVRVPRDQVDLARQVIADAAPAEQKD
jgi:hypothetical protein